MCEWLCVSKAVGEEGGSIERVKGGRGGGQETEVQQQKEPLL